MPDFLLRLRFPRKGAGEDGLHPAITLCLCRSTMRYAAVRFAEWAWVSGAVAAQQGSAGHSWET
ncbi:hypothetical protein SGLAM104S_06797 [Streptomyces glaucescens]